MICTRRKETNRKTHDPPECGGDTADAGASHLPIPRFLQIDLMDLMRAG
jgi:hypothetical protein